MASDGSGCIQLLMLSIRWQRLRWLLLMLAVVKSQYSMLALRVAGLITSALIIEQFWLMEIDVGRWLDT
jgi:hypothetical protein